MSQLLITFFQDLKKENFYIAFLIEWDAVKVLLIVAKKNI